MTFRIADTFVDSLAKLTGQEQKIVSAAAFQVQINPENPGLQMHRVDRARDKFFWTARVNRDIRLVIHKKAGDTLLAWVGHHDDAYRWAETRRIDTHPRTGAAQIVEIRETVEEVVVQKYVEEAVRLPRLFIDETEDALLSWGVPEDWLDTVRDATEDTVLDIASHLPMEAGEALVQAATGVRPGPAPIADDPFTHPDASRRFKVLESEVELAAALEAPWEKWKTFLHPAQREFVIQDFNGPARVIGSAGTGKTIVALHRAVRLAAENPGARVLLTTFNGRLAKSLSAKADQLASPAVQQRIEVTTLSQFAETEAKRIGLSSNIVTEIEFDEIVNAALEGAAFSSTFIHEEWRLIVDAWSVTDFEEYRELPRLGRRVRLAASKREEAWAVFQAMRDELELRGLATRRQRLHDLAAYYRSEKAAPVDFVVVDEAQDLSVAELMFLASIAGQKPNGLFFAGDIGQRIFRPPFPWSATGVEIRGRSKTLKLNYRTSEQIRRTSDQLLPTFLTESDGTEERRDGVVSLFQGQAPEISVFSSAESERDAAADWIAGLLASGLDSSEIAILVRSDDELAMGDAIREKVGTSADKMELMTMHRAKGLEFRAVAILGCNDDVIPKEDRLLSARDEAEIDEIMATERHLLYVAFSRAREMVWLSATGSPSEFMADLQAKFVDISD